MLLLFHKEECLIKNLYEIPKQSLEDELWHIGLNGHKHSQAERLQYIQFLSEKIDELGAKTIMNCLGYLLHAYFSHMTDMEKENYIRLLLSVDIKAGINFSDIIEMVGILYKSSPQIIRSKLLSYVLSNAASCISDPSAVISACNCLSYIFDEVGTKDKSEILLKLNELHSSNPYQYIDKSIEFTINSLKKGMAI